MTDGLHTPMDGLIKIAEESRDRTRGEGGVDMRLHGRRLEVAGAVDPDKGTEDARPALAQCILHVGHRGEEQGGRNGRDDDDGAVAQLNQRAENIELPLGELRVADAVAEVFEDNVTRRGGPADVLEDFRPAAGTRVFAEPDPAAITEVDQLLHLFLRRDQEQVIAERRLQRAGA